MIVVLLGLCVLIFLQNLTIVVGQVNNKFLNLRQVQPFIFGDIVDLGLFKKNLFFQFVAVEFDRFLLLVNKLYITYHASPI